MNKYPKEKQKLVDELHKPARINFKRRRVIIKGINDLLQIDLVEMIPYSRINKGYKYILTAINAFSKYAWAIPLKNKSSENVVNAMKIILKEFVPKNIQSDLGKEFYNKLFKSLMKKYKINHYSVYSTLKACIVERFNRTLKNYLYKYFSLRGSYKWLDILKEILQKYNNTIHSTIKMKPIDVNKNNEKSILQNAYSNLKIFSPRKFKKNDKVRISKIRNTFSKGYLPNWSTEIFTIFKVKNTTPVTYILKDYQNKIIKGAFYEQELQKVSNPDVYLVEKILRKKGDKYYVKWLGFDSNHNSYIKKSDLL